VVLDRVVAAGLDLELRREAKGFVLNGMPLPSSSAPADPDKPVVAPWGFDVAGIALSNSRLRLIDRDFTAEIAVDSLAVENINTQEPARAIAFSLKGRLNGAAIAVSGTVHPFAAEPTFAIALQLENLSLADFATLAARAGVKDLSGHADAALAIEGGQGKSGVSLKITGRLGLADAAISAPVTAKAKRLGLNLDRLAWDGRVVELEGKLDGAALAAKGEGGEGQAATLGLIAKRLTWDGRRVDWQGGLELGGAHVAVAGHDGSPDKLDWTGTLAVDTASGNGNAEGRLALGPLRLVVGDIATVIKGAEAEGKVEFGDTLAADLPKAAMDGLAVHDNARKLDWAEVGRIEATALRLDRKGAVTVARLGADSLSGLRKEGKDGFSWRFQTKHLRLDRASRDAKGDVALETVRLDGALARLNRDKEGLVGFDFSGPEDKAEDKAKGKAKADDEPLPAIRIGKLEIGGNSELRLRDRTSPETVRVNIVPLDFGISSLNSRQPDHDSPFDMTATVGRGIIRANGSIRPFAATITGNMEGKITALELPPLSPYLAEALGIHLQSGHFDGTLAVTANQGKLAGKLDVALSNLFIAAPDPNAPVVKKADMPIETVLDLLRDGDDRIRLSLPIRGDTANPDLDISDAVAQAVAGALKSTVLTTLKLAFPVAMLIEMAVDDDDKAHLALAPLPFAPGSDALMPEQEKTLDTVAQLLKSRPALTLTLCGKADDRDWPGIASRRRAMEKPLLSKLEKIVGVEHQAQDFGAPDRNMLSALAQRRTDAVRNFLADHGGIDSGRLFACRPTVESKDKGPRVELLL
jgi:outer membrane protein OmpA-like peptidoglycan-associated protein